MKLRLFYDEEYKGAARQGARVKAAKAAEKSFYALYISKRLFYVSLGNFFSSSSFYFPIMDSIELTLVYALPLYCISLWDGHEE